MTATPLNGYNCPSRRTGGPWPSANDVFQLYYYNNGGFTPSQAARSDYAANCGNTPADEEGAGPSSVADGNSGFDFGGSQWDGVVFAASYITFADISGGTSNTYLIGEKYLDPDNYYTGGDGSDNENMYVGFDNDINRCSAASPMRDTPGTQNGLIWGSAHAGGFNMANCDGSVRFISYTISLSVHQTSGSRFAITP